MALDPANFHVTMFQFHAVFMRCVFSVNSCQTLSSTTDFMKLYIGQDSVHHSAPKLQVRWKFSPRGNCYM